MTRATKPNQLPKRSISGVFFAAFIVACIVIGGTIQNNREIAQRRLVDPVQTVGTLKPSFCDSVMGGGRVTSRKVFVVLKYEYSTNDPAPNKHILDTYQEFDSTEACIAFEKANGGTATIWYERTHPEKASLYETESYSWVGLYGLILVAILVIWGVYDQKALNQARSELHREKRVLARLKKTRHS